MKTYLFKSWFLLTVLICCISQVFAQTYTKTQLEKAFTKYQDEFQLLKGHYPADEIAQFIEQKNPDYIYVFESYDLKTEKYSYSIRTYFLADKEMHQDFDKDIIVKHLQDFYIGQVPSYPDWHFNRYDKQLSYLDYGTEYIQMDDLLNKFSRFVSITPIQPHIEAYLGYNDSDEERERFKQKELYLNLPIIRTETLIDVKAKTSQQIHSVPLKMKAVIFNVWGEADVCR